MGVEPDKVDAECWMGDDDERPSNPDDSSVFTSEYDGSGDFWVVGQIPGRDGVNEETYSCVWGMKNVGSTTDTNFYESTNSRPLRARDGSREDITYDELENRYAANTPTDTGRSVWGPLQG